MDADTFKLLDYEQYIFYLGNEDGKQFWLNYRPQRSWAKVMFLQASVILLTGGVYLVWSRGRGVPGLVTVGGVYLV